MKSPSRRFNVSLIGAGKVGTTLALLFRRSGNNIVAVVSRNRDSAKRCGRIVSCRNCSDDLSAIPSSTNLILIAVPDRSIRSVAASIARLPLRFSTSVVFHTSGVHTSEELAPLASRGATVLSLHPMQTFPMQRSIDGQLRSMKGISYGIEGPSRSLIIGKQLVRSLGGIPLVVPKDAKILYHCACVIASNYAVTLVGAVEAISRTFARGKVDSFKPLVETSFANAFATGARNALTGPIARGDIEVVAKHLKSMKDHDLRGMYRALGIYATKLATTKKRKPGNLRKIRQMLKKLD